MNAPTTNSDSNEQTRVSTWLGKLGPYGEVLTVVAISCAAICFIFVNEPKVRIGLGLCALLAAIPCYIAAFTHRELSKQNEEEQNLRAGAVKYRVSTARLEVLRTAKVPRDVLTALKELAGRDPMSKEELISALVYDLDLGHERTKDFEAVILKYTKYDERPKATSTSAAAAPPPRPADAAEPAGEAREAITAH